MFISITQAIDVYEDLLSAYDGKNGYGSTEAEIYAYRLLPNTPALDNPNTSSFFDYSKEHRQAGKALVNLIELFISRHHDAMVTIDGVDYFDWHGVIGEGFHHRCHIRITKYKND